MDVFLTWAHAGKRKYALCSSEDDARRYQERVAAIPTCTDFSLEPVRPCLEHFERLVRSHDLTYMMSDSRDVHRRGHASYQRIVTMATALAPDEVARIWNTWVDTQLVPDEAPRWHWKGAP
jgi:hypothetical protein